MITLPLVEVHVVHHCNLNCAGCAHFAPLADDNWELSTAQLATGLNALLSAGVEPSAVRLFGGEPTLHSSLSDLFAVVRNLLPAVRLTVMSNGVNAKQQLMPLVVALKKNDVIVEFTQYPHVDLGMVTKMLRSVDVDVLIFSSNKKLRHHRILQEHNDKLNSDCIMRAGSASVQLVCTPVPSLWSCPVTAYSWVARKVFTDFPVPGDDCRVLLDHVVTNDELNKLVQPTSFCNCCAVGPENIPWHVSTCSRGEW